MHGEHIAHGRNAVPGCGRRGREGYREVDGSEVRQVPGTSTFGAISLSMSGKTTKKKRQTSFATVAPQQMMNSVLHSFIFSELTPEPQSVQLQLKMKRKRTTPKKMALKKSTLRLLIHNEKQPICTRKENNYNYNDKT